MRQAIVPARISMALALTSLRPAEVDVRLGVLAGMVDLWCDGQDEPDEDQLAALSALTDFPIEFFWRPMALQEHVPVRLFMCDRRSRRGATVVRFWIDDRKALRFEPE
jgi:hypothetical protein